MEEKEKISIKVFIIIAIISVIVLALIVGAIVLNNNSKAEVINEEKEGAEITLNYADKESKLALTNMKATKDAEGVKNDAADKVFNFTVNTELIEAESADYEIYVTKNKKECNIPDDYLRLYLEKESDGTFNKVVDATAFKPLTKKDSLGVPKDSMVLFKDSVDASASINYRLKMWLAEDFIAQDGEVINCSVSIAIKGKAK